MKRILSVFALSIAVIAAGLIVGCNNNSPTSDKGMADKKMKDGGSDKMMSDKDKMMSDKDKMMSDKDKMSKDGKN